MTQIKERVIKMIQCILEDFDPEKELQEAREEMFFKREMRT